MAAFLQTLKDTAARTAEAIRIKWTEIDEKQCTIRINSPVKGSNATIDKVSPKKIDMINNLPRTTEYVFNSTPQNIRNNFDKQRRRLIRDPRIQNCEKFTYIGQTLESDHGIPQNQKHQIRPEYSRPQEA